MIEDPISCPMCDSTNVTVNEEGKLCNNCGFSTSIIDMLEKAEEIRKEILEITKTFMG